MKNIVLKNSLILSNHNSENRDLTAFTHRLFGLEPKEDHWEAEEYCPLKHLRKPSAYWKEQYTWTINSKNKCNQKRYEKDTPHLHVKKDKLKAWAWKEQLSLKHFLGI